jgi:tRNA(Ile)-lysidine synthetase-like protein
LTIWREETEGYCRANDLDWRTDSTNPSTKRGLVRERILPLLEELDPRARQSLLALGAERPRLPRRLEASLVELLSSLEGTRAADLGGGLRAVRTYDTLRLEGVVEWGPWRLETDVPGLVVRSRRPGDRLAGRSRKVQDVLVDAKVPRDERDGWPLVATEDGAVVTVVGLAEAPGWEGAVRAARGET